MKLRHSGDSRRKILIDKTRINNILVFVTCYTLRVWIITDYYQIVFHDYTMCVITEFSN
jgi:hypothetical protein